MINEKLPHIGIVTNKKSRDGKRNLIVHNVGGGQVMEDCLFDYKIVGHYKYKKQKANYTMELALVINFTQFILRLFN